MIRYIETRQGESFFGGKDLTMPFCRVLTECALPICMYGLKRETKAVAVPPKIYKIEIEIKP
jgi:hypothetical protein